MTREEDMDDTMSFYKYELDQINRAREMANKTSAIYMVADTRARHVIKLDERPGNVSIAKLCFPDGWRYIPNVGHN